MTRQRMNSSLAVISMVFAVLGWTALPVLGGIVAIITGHMARNEIRFNPNLDGNGMALGGLLLGYAMVVLLALLLVAGLGIFLLFGRVALMEMLGQ